MSELERKADRLMHACQRAEEEGNWPLFERLSEEWDRIESLLMEMEMEENK